MPIKNTGRWASASIAAARAIDVGSPAGRGGTSSAAVAGRSASSCMFIKRSSGISRNTGPGTPACAMRMAESMYSAMRRVSGTCTLHFVIGFMSETQSMSCSEPMSVSSRGPAPPMHSIGMPARCALATAVTTSVTPGPAVTAHTPGSPVTRA